MGNWSNDIIFFGFNFIIFKNESIGVYKFNIIWKFYDYNGFMNKEKIVWYYIDSRFILFDIEKSMM